MTTRSQRRMAQDKRKTSPEAVELRQAALDFWTLRRVEAFIGLHGGAVYEGHSSPSNDPEDKAGQRRWERLDKAARAYALISIRAQLAEVAEEVVAAREGAWGDNPPADVVAAMNRIDQVLRSLKTPTPGPAPGPDRSS